MILNIKCYPQELSESEFYSHMGKYFAERKYRKEMPYLINDSDYNWVLYFKNNGELVAFYHYKFKKDIVELGGLYVVEEYRCQGLAKRIMNEQMHFFKEHTMTTTSNNPVILKLRKRLGFVGTKKKGSYTVLTKKN